MSTEILESFNCPEKNRTLLLEPSEVLSLPSGWIELSVPGPHGPTHLAAFGEYDTEASRLIPTFLKSVLVNFLDSTVTKYMRGNLCDMLNSGKLNLVIFESNTQLNTIIKDFDEETMCRFIREEKYKDVGHVASGSCVDGIWKANE